MRQTVFISHATPEDSNFTLWLSLQLIGLGYIVWSDVLKLKGGEDWWPVIENEIRNNSIKFIVVLSEASNNKDGVLKELAVAQKVKKQLDDSLFIIPLHIDNKLSYDDINVELIRLNSINFKKSWADGLKSLLELFEEQNIHKSNSNYEQVNNLWQTVYLHEKHPIESEEIYFSNWFPITEIPPMLRFHKFNYALPGNFKLSSLSYPAIQYKEFVATFGWCYDFMEELPKTTTYNSANSLEISTSEIINGTFSNKFIQNKEAKKIIIQLLNKAFDKTLQKKPLSVYQMSNKISFWIKKGILEKDKFNKIQLVGKQKEKQWHYGISGNLKLFPELCFIINSHIWFTTDGENLIPDASKQHASRRKQGKNWWNNDWRNKTIAFMQFISESDNTIHLQLGSEEVLKISNNPILFKSNVTYIDPNTENLPGDDFDFETGLEDNADYDLTQHAEV